MRKTSGHNQVFFALFASLVAACGANKVGINDAVAGEETSTYQAVTETTESSSLGTCRSTVEGKTLSEVAQIIQSRNIPAECQPASQKLHDTIAKLKTRFPSLGKRLPSDGDLKQQILEQCGDEIVGSSELPTCIREVLRSAFTARIGSR